MSRGAVFVGWIPNVAGRLSFSHIGASGYPTRCLRQNTGNQFGRRLVVSQRRRLADWLLPDWYFRLTYGYSAQWQFVLIASSRRDPSDQIGRLEGEVLVFEHPEWDAFVDAPGGAYTPKEVFGKSLIPWASEAPGSNAVDLLPDSALDLIRPCALFSFHVGIRRSGIAWLRLKSTATDVTFAEDYDSPEHAPKSDDIKYIANQVFFFLKDVSHSHRHHPPGNDTITELGELDYRRTWAIDTHYRIHRKVVEMRRSKEPKTLYKALGVLAYLSALGKAVRHGEIPRRRSPLSYNNSEIESSLKAEIEVRRWDQTQRNIIKTALPALSIALIALTGYDDNTIGGFIRSHVNAYFQSHHGQIAMMMGFLILTVPFYYGVADFWSLPFVLRAKRVLVSSSQRAHGLFWVMAGLLAMLIGVGELGLAWLMHFWWASFLRAHPRLWSWIAAVGIGLSTFAVALVMPFWATRRDLTDAVARRLAKRFGVRR